MRVKNGASDETEATLLHILAHRIRYGRCSQDVRILLQPVLLRLPVDEPPDVVAERAKLILDLEECPGIGHGRVYLELVTHHTGILQDLVDALLREASDLLRIEVGERLPVTVALPEDGRPAESCLGAFEDQELELRPVVPHR